MKLAIISTVLAHPVYWARNGSTLSDSPASLSGMGKQELVVLIAALVVFGLDVGQRDIEGTSTYAVRAPHDLP